MLEWVTPIFLYMLMQRMRVMDEEKLRALLSQITPMSVRAVAALERELQESRRLYIIAPTYYLAQHYAARHGIARNRVVYIHQESQLYGYSGEVLWLNRDSNGEFDFTNAQWRILDLARELEAAKRITLRSVAMETPPFEIKVSLSGL